MCIRDSACRGPTRPGCRPLTSSTRLHHSAPACGSSPCAGRHPYPARVSSPTSGAPGSRSPSGYDTASCGPPVVPAGDSTCSEAEGAYTRAAASTGAGHADEAHRPATRTRKRPHHRSSGPDASNSGDLRQRFPAATRDPDQSWDHQGLRWQRRALSPCEAPRGNVGKGKPIPNRYHAALLARA